MDEIKLDVQVRQEIGKRNIKLIRREGFLPGVVYGGKKKVSTVIKVDKRKYEKIMRHHQGESVVFHLNVLEGSKKLRDYSAIVKEEQHDSVTHDLVHVDFNRISLTEELEVKVTLTAKGEAVGVKRDGGSLEQIMWELDIICLPTNIPQHIEMDVTELEIGDSIHVKELTIPEGVRTKHDPEAVVLTVIPPRKEEELEPHPEDGEGEPELIDGKKEKAEGEEAEAQEEKREDKKEEKAEEKSKE